MSAQDRLAEKLKSMKKEKLSSKERSEDDGMRRPGKKEESRSSVTLDDRATKGGAKRQTVGVRYNKDGVSAGVDVKSKAGKKNKINSAFARADVGSGVSIEATHDKGRSNDHKYNVGISKRFGGNKQSAGEEKMKRMKQLEKAKDL